MLKTIKRWLSRDDCPEMTDGRQFVVCETIAAIVLHVRQGTFQKCGHQDSETLCGSHPAWDTQIPVEVILSPNPESRICGICKNLLMDHLKEKNDVDHIGRQE